MDTRIRGRPRRIGAALVLLVAVPAALLLGRSLWSADAADAIDVYAFSTLEELMTHRVFVAFEAEWAAMGNAPVKLDGVFGPSGTLAGQINLGAPADIALLSHASHVAALKLGRRVRGDAEGVVFCRTPMAIVARSGNPAGLSAWADLAGPGLTVLHPDPRTSGAGGWGVLAVYGSVLQTGGTPEEAERALREVWRNVRYVAPSARAAMTLFELGAGDALVTYEQDARLALERGVGLDVILPDSTIVAEAMAVIVDVNVTRSERPAAEAFVRFLTGPEGQAACAAYHLRPAAASGAAFPALVRPFTVDALGGWSEASHAIVQGLWERHVVPDLELLPNGGAPGMGNG